MQEKEFSKGPDGVEELKSGIGVVGAIEIVHTDDTRDVFFAVDVVFGFEKEQLLEIFSVVMRLQIEFDIFESVTFDFVVVRETKDFGGG